MYKQYMTPREWILSQLAINPVPYDELLEYFITDSDELQFDYIELIDALNGLELERRIELSFSEQWSLV